MADKVIVFGATGTIGKFLIASLIQNSKSFERLAIFARSSTIDSKPEYVQFLKDSGVEIITGDVRNEADVLKAYEGFNIVVSAVGRNVILDQIDLIRLAEKTPNIKRFFPSEFGTDIEFGPKSPNEKPHQLKLKVRGYIKNEVKRLEHTYLVTGPYAEFYIGKGFGDQKAGGFDVQAKKAVLCGTGDDKVALMTMPDVGDALVSAILHPEASKNRALIVNSFTTTPHEILAEYEKQTGSKWDVSYTLLDELVHLEEQAWNAEEPRATGFTLRRVWTEGGTLYDRPRDNEAIGFTTPDSLADAVATAIKVQS
ncbi:isoflavone reductase family protein [Tothia fuscella]|uniref:Isoflavone reductase family protein n=1 Tax=Tothia fuscella TaxID=1048955 RepID=A0A9P4NFF2_9PEZI|nr:isoflavone reductase family protein [Tothia fuscella]